MYLFFRILEKYFSLKQFGVGLPLSWSVRRAVGTPPPPPPPTPSHPNLHPFRNVSEGDNESSAGIIVPNPRPRHASRRPRLHRLLLHLCHHHYSAEPQHHKGNHHWGNGFRLSGFWLIVSSSRIRSLHIIIGAL